MSPSLAGVTVRAARSRDPRTVVGEDLPAASNNATPAFADNSPLLAVDPVEPRFVAMAYRLDAPDFAAAWRSPATADGPSFRLGPSRTCQLGQMLVMRP